MESFDLTAPTGAFGATVVLIATVTQLVKAHTPLKGYWVVAFSVLLGSFLGATGLEDVGRSVFPSMPGTWSGLLVGFLAGCVASGGKDLVTGIQKNGAKARVQAEVAAARAPAADAQEDVLPEYRAATIEDILKQTGEWPAVPGLDSPPPR